MTVLSAQKAMEGSGVGTAVAVGNGGAGKTGTSSTLVASMKAADTHPVPAAVAGSYAAHHAPSALLPMILPLVPNGARPMTW